MFGSPPKNRIKESELGMPNSMKIYILHLMISLIHGKRDSQGQNQGLGKHLEIAFQEMTEIFLCYGKD